MKELRIILFILIIIGFGLLATQKLWVTKLVDIVLKSENPNYQNNYNKPISVRPVGPDTTLKPISEKEKSMIEYSIQKKFGVEWQGVIDGCGEGSLTKIRSITRISDGYKVEIYYLCGFIMKDTPPEQTIVYVSTSGVVKGLPSPNYR